MNSAHSDIRQFYAYVYCALNLIFISWMFAKYDLFLLLWFNLEAPGAILMLRRLRLCNI